jgi:hypothetical protein
MESLQNMDQQGYVETSLLQRKDAYASDNIKEIPSLNVLSQEVNVEVVLEGPVVLHKKGRVLQTD